jgi:branched-chain amino acid transport system substrate-binding protein
MSNFNVRGAVIASTILIALGGFSPAVAAEKVLKIGAPLPLTGPLAPDGQRLKSGYDL